MVKTMNIKASGKNEVPFMEGLWSIPSSLDEKPQLIASKCKVCGEIFFPKKQICTYCMSRDLEVIKLSRKGKIYSITVVMQKPPGPWYRGLVPYAVGYVELPDGIRVETLFTGCEPDALEIGMEVELVIAKLYENEEGNNIMAHKFRPV